MLGRSRLFTLAPLRREYSRQYERAPRYSPIPHTPRNEITIVLKVDDSECSGVIRINVGNRQSIIKAINKATCESFDETVKMYDNEEEGNQRNYARHYRDWNYNYFFRTQK